MQITTANLCDSMGSAAQPCLADWRSFGGRTSAAGAVQTVRVFEDAALIRQVLGEEGQGRILVVDAGASRRVAVLGDRMAKIGRDHGWAGVLIHGAVRDVDILRDIDICVLALGAVPSRGGKAGTGEIGVEVSIAGTPIRPGDFIALDSDGAVVSGAADCVDGLLAG